MTSHSFLVSCTPDWSLFIYCGPYRWEETDGRKVQRYLDQIRQNAFSTTIEIDNSLSISMLNPPTIKPPSTDNPPRISKDVKPRCFIHTRCPLQHFVADINWCYYAKREGMLYAHIACTCCITQYCKLGQYACKLGQCVIFSLITWSTTLLSFVLNALKL